MKEEFLHFIFRNRLWDKSHIILTDGRELEILDVGTHNLDSGPDFFNAKIKINDTIWVGNIEIHIDSADWYKHNHHKDLAYSNVVLHVVFNHSKEVYLAGKEKVPVWEMSFPQVLFNKYSELKNNEKQIPCQEYFALADTTKVKMWLERMGVERLEYKSEMIQKYLDLSNNDWEYAFYINLCRSFGGKINAFPFEQIALRTPLKLVRKYSFETNKLEALLFGQSGLLGIAINDDYVLNLKSEYNYLRKLHNLSPIQTNVWKFSKLRPSNFPQIKIAQLISVLSDFQGLFSSVITNPDYKSFKDIFKVEVSSYWKSHYVFGKPVNSTNSGFGITTLNTLVINTIAPFIFKYLNSKDENLGSVTHSKILNGIKPENNRIIRTWKEIGLEADSAFESQALIHLKANYCDKIKCLNCQIGNSIMQQLGSL